jgi:hypothetical protein
VTVIQYEGDERSLEWSLNDDGTLDLFVETRKGHQKERGNSPMMKTETISKRYGIKIKIYQREQVWKCGGNLIIPNSVILNP